MKPHHHLYGLLALFFLFIQIPGSLCAQWTTIATGTEVRTDLFFHNELSGTGIKGNAILKTTDGGVSWVNWSSTMGNTWGGEAITFTKGGSQGFIAKDNTSTAPSTTDLYVSADSGSTWSNAFSLMPDDIASIQFPANDTGYTLTTNGFEPGALFVTHNCGSSWSTAYRGGANTRFNHMKFISAETGYLAGYVDDSVSTIFRTFDGGANWDSLATSPQLNGSVTFEVSTPARAFVASGFAGQLYRSTDSCATWDLVHNDSNLFIKHIRFPSVDTGYFVAHNLSLSVDEIYFSSDSGATWNVQTFDGFGISTLFFLNPHKGWVVGISGNIATLDLSSSRSSPSMQSYTVYPVPAKGSLHLSFINPGPREIMIHDLNGSLIRTWNSQSDALEIHDLQMGPGMYLLSVKERNQAPFIRSIIIE